MPSSPNPKCPALSPVGRYEGFGLPQHGAGSAHLLICPCKGDTLSARRGSTLIPRIDLTGVVMAPPWQVTTANSLRSARSEDASRHSVCNGTAYDMRLAVPLC